ncbi:ABC transporter permease/M1 family aminopeptidase [Croceivirga thetidis]|uniref:Peptidase M1 n=1 Tax=Croceivirga thetidis TaxID=2721623 RepID=A0ABX1GTU2_9FLAO|nr:M1 family aminopeptidase [Croceivirga thetidis]NKI32340.1 peptidase M1 [Croceivirga thetidis]
MWKEHLKFELRYRSKRPETYVFFVFLMLFSIVGIDFIFQGVEIGLVKKNAPLVIAKTMGATTGIFMILVSMIMGVPVLRDSQYAIQSLLYSNPITKRDYLLGRFLGSFAVLLFIFSGLLFGMMLGYFLPWHEVDKLRPFNAWSYVECFVVVVLPILFFGAALFFVTGMLSKRLLLVYTQGVVMFVLFLLTKAITNEYLQGLLDPFSLTTLTQFTEDWSIEELNSYGISLSGILLYNKLLWLTLGGIMLLIGYQRFSFSLPNKKSRAQKVTQDTVEKMVSIPTMTKPEVYLNFSLRGEFTQLLELTKFHIFSLLKETAFWAIVICGVLIIAINSVNLGTVYGVNSYPATHFIIAELQEMSLYFFVVILLFYSGQLVWKERAVKQYLLNDATPVSNLVVLAAKYLALNGIYIVLMACLIIAGILLQASMGFYEFELGVYFSGFFVEILPFLSLYTFIAFFFQVVSKNKFIGILLSLMFFILNVGSEALGFNHSLYKFGGKPLGIYSEMNGYGHFLQPYLWVKAYWMVFGILILIGASLVLRRGEETELWKRIKTITYRLSNTTKRIAISLIVVFLILGSYIFYNTNVLNTYWTAAEEQEFRANYERTLKPLEYISQPKITAINLDMELYPETRSYDLKGSYQLTNTTEKPINEIHIQKLLASHVDLVNVEFEGGAVADSTYAKFDYTMYQLQKPLQPESSIQLNFEQSFHPKGFENDVSDTQLVYNGSFLNNSILPSLGYNRKYELNSPDERKEMGLPKRRDKALINDKNELVNARSGSDSDGTMLRVKLGTSEGQTAIAPGKLEKKWSENGRNYFVYTNEQPIINFYAIVSAEYEVKKDTWQASDYISKPVALEIYHHKSHTYTLDRMMKGMKASLDYYSTNFSPYPYEQLRIMEVPRYADYAQSLPNTIPFSEALGFVLDIDDETDADMAFYITAHEMAHQWFGMQVEAANVQGKNFVLETMAQYGALMVLKANYPKEKVQQFLDLQQEIYEKERKKAKVEQSLTLVENQDFVYYNKGVLAMYQLQELIGEDQVNKALNRFITDWRSYSGDIKSQTNRYTTSMDLLEYFIAEAPEKIQGEVRQLFE